MNDASYGNLVPFLVGDVLGGVQEIDDPLSKKTESSNNAMHLDRVRGHVVLTTYPNLGFPLRVESGCGFVNILF